MLTKVLKVLVIALFTLGLLATGVLGTETRSLLFWPGCTLLAAAGLIAGLRWRWRLKFMPSDVCLATALLFGIYLLVRQLASPVFAYAREDMVLLMACAVAYTLGATVLSDPRSRNWLLIVVALLTLGNTVMAAFHHSGNWTFHILQQWYERPFYENRIGGFFVNPNHLASFFAMSSLLLAATAIFGRGGAAWKLLLGFVSLIAAIGIALTMSRGGLLGLAAGGITFAVAGVYVLCKTQRHLVGKVLAGIAVVCVLGGVMLYGVFSEQLQKRLGGAGFSEGDPRPHIWRAALAQHAEQPLLGVGARMFQDGCVTHRTADSPPWMMDAEFAHNEWLQMLADYGWVGLLLALVLFGTHLANLVRYLRWFVSEKFPHTATLMSSGLGMVLGAFAALVALLAHAVFEFNFHVPIIAVLAACLLGICANPGCTPVGRSPRRVPGVRVTLKAGLIALPAALLCGMWIFGRADYYAEKAALATGEDDATPAKLEALSKAIALDPRNAALWESRGSVRLTAASGQPVDLARSLVKRAAVDLEEARRLNPQSFTAALELANALAFLGEADRSRQAIDDALALAPLFEGPRLALASYYQRLSQWQKSEEAYFFASEAQAGKSGKWFTEYTRMLQGAADAAK
jgi:O-antigen ligase